MPVPDIAAASGRQAQGEGVGEVDAGEPRRELGAVQEPRERLRVLLTLVLTSRDGPDPVASCAATSPTRRSPPPSAG